ncbi:hypothetical protein [Azomonas macrocytogenes]|uniref:Uncharacterized protein n=1 Tax=Azomonas macrocytogenes TaxID=69962 RepID=A0A839T9T8_AZOMA|nr:hypothetical protein [Azomonas macrocytogenes]MBB3104393.1 hypothetical protein [Azomonas macrocytogenes]
MTANIDGFEQALKRKKQRVETTAENSATFETATPINEFRAALKNAKPRSPDTGEIPPVRSEEQQGIIDDALALIQSAKFSQTKQTKQTKQTGIQAAVDRELAKLYPELESSTLDPADTDHLDENEKAVLAKVLANQRKHPLN